MLQKKGKHDDGKIKCSNCGRDIKNERYLRCSRCINVIMCLECYCTKVDCNPPPDQKELIKCHHQFLIMDPDPQPIFRSDWDSNEEILLLNGVKLLGIGNWNAIAEWLKPRTAAEIEAHYMQTYIFTEGNPLPEPRVLEPAIVPPPPTYSTKPQESCPSEGHEKHLNDKKKKDRTNCAEYSGWMPYRHEFEVEYNNDAEELVAHIEFQNDSQQTFEEKINFLQSYNIQLRKRHARNKVIEEWDIEHIEQRPNQTRPDIDLETKLLGCTTPEQKQIDTKLIPFSQYMKKEDLQKIADDAHQILKLNDQIERRRKWQMHGVRNVPEGQLYDELEKCQHDGKMTPADGENWNRSIDNYTRKFRKDCEPEMKLLSQKEVDFITQHKIEGQLYVSYKDLLFRE